MLCNITSYYVVFCYIVSSFWYYIISNHILACYARLYYVLSLICVYTCLCISLYIWHVCCDTGFTHWASDGLVIGKRIKVRPCHNAGIYHQKTIHLYHYTHVLSVSRINTWNWIGYIEIYDHLHFIYTKMRVDGATWKLNAESKHSLHTSSNNLSELQKSCVNTNTKLDIRLSFCRYYHPFLWLLLLSIIVGSRNSSYICDTALHQPPSHVLFSAYVSYPSGEEVDYRLGAT